MIVWTPAVLGVLYVCVLNFCICTCSAQLSVFHMERRSRNTLIIIIIIIMVYQVVLSVVLVLTSVKTYVFLHFGGVMSKWKIKLLSSMKSYNL